MKKVAFEDTKNGKIGTNGMMLSISKMLNLCITLCSSMLLARFRTLEEYGTFSEINTVVALAVSVFCIGLPSCLNYFVPRCENQAEQDNFVSLYYVMNTILATVTGIILLLCTPVIAWYYKNDSLIYFSYALAIMPWANIILKSRDNLLIATNQCKRAVIYNLAQGITSLGIIVLIQVLDQDFRFYFILYVIEAAFFSLLVYREALRLVSRVIWKISKDLLKEVLKYAVPLGLSSAVGTLSLELDKLVVGWFYSTEQLALYANCGKELPIAYIATSFSAVVMPAVVRNIKEGKVKIAIDKWKETIEFSAIIIVFFIAACLVFAPQMVSLLYSEKYLAGVAIFRVYALVLLFRVTAFAMVLNALGHTKTIFWNSVLALIANIILNIILTVTIGFVGSAVATVISVGIQIMALLISTSRQIFIPVAELFPWKTIVLLIGINAAGGICVFTIIQILHLGTDGMDILAAIGIGVVWLGLYILLLRRRLLTLWKSMNHIENIGR